MAATVIEKLMAAVPQLDKDRIDDLIAVSYTHLDVYKRQGLNRAIDLAEKEYDGLVVGNQGANFSVGANLAMILMMAIDQDWDDLNMACLLYTSRCV